MPFLTEVECNREVLVNSILCSIPDALQRALKPNDKKHSGTKYFLPKQSPSPLDARENDFYVFKRMSRMLDSEFPQKIGSDSIDPLDGFRAAPHVKVKGSSSTATPAVSSSTSKAKKLLEDARAWDFKYSEAIEQSEFLKTRESKLKKSGQNSHIPMNLTDATSRSDILTNFRMLSEITINSSDESDDDEYPMSPTCTSKYSSEVKKSSPLKSFKTKNRSSLCFGKSLRTTSNAVLEFWDDNDILLSDNEAKRAIIAGQLTNSRTIMQTELSDPDSDETDKELSEMKRILENAKCRPFLDSRRCDHDELNPYGNSDFLNEYQDERQRSLARLQQKKNLETAPKAKRMHVKIEKFKSAENAFFDSLKKEIVNAESTSKFQVKSHLFRPRQLDGNPGYEYQRYCELHSIPIQKQIALKNDAPEIEFVNITIAGSPQASAVAHFLRNTANLRKVVIDACSVRGTEFNVLSASLANLVHLSSLILIGADFSNDQSNLSSSFSQLTSLTELFLRNCKLDDFGGSLVVKAVKPNTKLTKICLAQNMIGMRTCSAIAEVLCDPWINWQDVDLSWNHVQGSSPVLMLACLAKNYTLQKIDLSWNGMRHESSLFAFCDALSRNDSIKFVNLSNCSISDYGALLIADLLQKTRSLTELNLLRNPICSFGCRSILRTLGLRQMKSPELSSVKVSLPVEQNSVMESTFDIATLVGKVKLDLNLPSHRHILNAIFKRKKETSVIIVGAVQYTGMPWQFDNLIEVAKRLEQDLLKRLHDGVERTWNGAQDSEPEPDKTKENQLEETVLFIPKPKDDEESSSKDDESGVSTENSTVDEDIVEDVAASTQTFIGRLSNNCATFELMSGHSESTAHCVVTPFEFDYFIHLIKSIDLTVPGNALRQFDAVKLLFSGKNVMKSADIIKILNQVCDDYKIQATKLSMTRCIEQSGIEKILENLSQTEYVSLSKIVSGSIMKFTPNNPTGRYVLHLSDQLDRDFFQRLIGIKMFQDEILKSDPVWQSYRYNNIERNFLNPLLDGRPIIIDRFFLVPSNGYVTFDFVSHIPPNTGEFPGVSEKNILEFIIGPQDESEKLGIFRKWTNINVFTVQQAIRLLGVFSGDTNRVEFCVTVFNRLIDWHGRLRLHNILSSSAMKMLVSRIGYQNLWDDATAVRYHEYDLSVSSERFCVGRLVDLAVLEPGENMCYEHFNEREFQCPASWANDDVPKKGLFSVYYCRSDRVVAGLISRYPPHTLPPNFLQLQPSGQEWVELHKRNRLRGLIREKFPDPARAFLVMDESGDGSLSRQEFARGLRLLGIDLKAHELANLIELLDEDGGGEIDSEEFIAFVNSSD